MYYISISYEISNDRTEENVLQDGHIGAQTLFDPIAIWGNGHFIAVSEIKCLTTQMMLKFWNGPDGHKFIMEEEIYDVVYYSGNATFKVTEEEIREQRGLMNPNIKIVIKHVVLTNVRNIDENDGNSENN